MSTPNQLQRLAAMGNTLRPDWPTSSLYTYLAKHHANRAYRDLAVALAWIATDPDTQTPARLAEPGPWWAATNPASTQRQVVAVTARQGCCGGLHAPDSPCDPRECQRSNGRGADLARKALAAANTERTT